jgi:predicted small metal-binding protein
MESKPDLEVDFVKEFSCGSVVAGCTAVFHARTADEILAQVARHAREDHGLTEITAELMDQVRHNIRTL